jgi:hypothetical protein
MILHITFYLPCPLSGGGIIVQETKMKHFIVEGYYGLYYSSTTVHIFIHKRVSCIRYYSILTYVSNKKKT